MRKGAWENGMVSMPNKGERPTADKAKLQMGAEGLFMRSSDE